MSEPVEDHGATAPEKHPRVPPKRFRPTRRKARKYALDVLYVAELLDRSIWEALDERAAQEDLPLAPYSRQLIEGVASHLTAIDDAIVAGLSEEWTIDRMPRVDRNLARIAVYEFVYADVPAAVATSEAAALAEELSTDGSSRFLQGLLGGVEKAVMGEDAPKEPRSSPSTGSGLRLSKPATLAGGGPTIMARTNRERQRGGDRRVPPFAVFTADLDAKRQVLPQPDVTPMVAAVTGREEDESTKELRLNLSKPSSTQSDVTPPKLVISRSTPTVVHEGLPLTEG